MNNKNRKYFTDREIEVVSSAAKVAEEIVFNHWNFTQSHFKKNSFDIKTLKDLRAHEIVDGQFAQLVSYDVIPNDKSLKSENITMYYICIQDHCILSFLNENPLYDLFALSLYVITHELIHVVRFSTFKASYVKLNRQIVQNEEMIVHCKTYELLKNYKNDSLERVLDFYSKWRDNETL